MSEWFVFPKKHGKLKQETNKNVYACGGHGGWEEEDFSMNIILFDHVNVLPIQTLK